MTQCALLHLQVESPWICIFIKATRRTSVVLFVSGETHVPVDPQVLLCRHVFLHIRVLCTADRKNKTKATVEQEATALN